MMIDATVVPKVGFISPFGATVCNVNHINARHEPLPEAEAQRRLQAVGSMPLFGQDCHLNIGCLASQSLCRGIRQGAEVEVSAPPVPRLVYRPL